MLPDWCLSGSGRIKKDQAHHSADRLQCEPAFEAVGERLANILCLADITTPWILYTIDDSTRVIDLAKFPCLAARKPESTTMEPWRFRSPDVCSAFGQNRVDGYICFHPALKSIILFNQVISMNCGDLVRGRRFLTQLLLRKNGVLLMFADQSVAHAATVLCCDEHHLPGQEPVHPRQHGKGNDDTKIAQSTQLVEEPVNAQISNLGGIWTVVDCGEEGEIWEEEEIF